MKIICVARNYADHVREMSNPLPEAPVLFIKPDTALIQNNQPFPLPDFSQLMHYETEIVLRICKDGKNIPEKNAEKYFNALTVGIDFTARDLQTKMREKGLPWAISKSFDGSAVVGKFIPLSDVKDIHALAFYLKKNGEIIQKGNTKDMIFSYGKMLSYASQFFTLQKGDLIFTGSPFGVGPVKVGDMLEGFLGEKKLFHCDVINSPLIKGD